MKMVDVAIGALSCSVLATNNVSRRPDASHCSETLNAGRLRDIASTMAWVLAAVSFYSRVRCPCERYGQYGIMVVETTGRRSRPIG